MGAPCGQMQGAPTKLMPCVSLRRCNAARDCTPPQPLGWPHLRASLRCEVLTYRLRTRLRPRALTCTQMRPARPSPLLQQAARAPGKGRWRRSAGRSAPTESASNPGSTARNMTDNPPSGGGPDGVIAVPFRHLHRPLSGAPNAGRVTIRPHCETPRLPQCGTVHNQIPTPQAVITSFETSGFSNYTYEFTMACL